MPKYKEINLDFVPDDFDSSKVKNGYRKFTTIN